MADELKLDIIVDDHGGVKKLADVDDGVNKVKGSAQQTTPEVAKLGGAVGGLASNARLLAIGVGIAIPAVTFFASTLRGAAADADKLADATEHLGGSAARLQQLAAAAGEVQVPFETMVDGLSRFQKRLEAGQIDAPIQRLVGDLEAFKRLDIHEQFLRASDALGKIGDEGERTRARAQLLGRDTQAMARLMGEGFREAADEAVSMSDTTIRELDEMADAFDRTVTKVKTKAKSLVAEGFLGFLNLMGRGGWQEAAANRDNPEPPSAPGVPQLPVPRAISPDTLKQLLAADQEDLLMRQALEEANFSMDEYLRKLGRVIEFKPDFVAIAEIEVQLAADGERWADVLEQRVGGAVDALTGKLRTALLLNTELMSGAQQERDRLMAKLTATTDPTKSEYDRRFDEIDQEQKRKLALVDQTDRGTAERAENAIIEETNLKILELQQSWEGVLQKKDSALEKAAQLKSSYEQLAGVFNPPGGTALPAGLTPPTAEQLATGRYFGPVTPNGEPDLARMGGAAPITTYHVDARGSVFDSEEAFIARVERALADRERDRGIRTGR